MGSDGFLECYFEDLRREPRTINMPVRYFPIINQESGLALEACQGPNGLVALAEYTGRDKQLWFTERDTILCKVYPKKVLTLDENWNRRGWGKVHLQARHFMLETQKWKFMSGAGEIVSLCRNPNRLDSLKLMIAGRPGTELLCSKMKRGSQQKWLYDANLRQGQGGAALPNSNFVASNVTVTPIKVVPPEVHQDLECIVCLEMMGCNGSYVFQCFQSHLICHSCRPKLDRCPVCREPYPNKMIRNRMAEKISQLVCNQE